MSFNINYQKTNTSSLFADRLVVRRYWYDKDLKKQKSKVIFSVSESKAPLVLPKDVIEKHEVTPEEHNKYKQFMLEKANKDASTHVRVGVDILIDKMSNLTEELKDRSDGVTLSQIEKFDAAHAELRRELSRHRRNAKKRGEITQAKKEAADHGQHDIIDDMATD